MRTTIHNIYHTKPKSSRIHVGFEDLRPNLPGHFNLGRFPSSDQSRWLARAVAEGTEVPEGYHLSLSGMDIWVRDTIAVNMGGGSLIIV